MKFQKKGPKTDKSIIHYMNKSVNPSIIFFGTPEFALPAFEALIKNGYTIAAVVTRPDERAGRKQILTPPPIKITAERHGIPVFQPEKLDPSRFASEIPQADLFVVVAYGKIIPKEILEMPRYGCLNIHPSLLPRWRGSAPIQYAILRGDTETGVTIIKMDEEVDHGPIIAIIKHVKHSMFDNEMYPSLHDTLAREGAVLLIQTLPRWIAGEITPVPQDHAKATYSKMLTRDSGRIDWKKSAEEIELMIRAFHPWPGTWSTWTTETKTIRVRIAEAELSPDMPPTAGAPGLVWRDGDECLCVATGQGSLAIRIIGAEGKTITDAASFVRGHPDIIGATLS